MSGIYMQIRTKDGPHDFLDLWAHACGVTQAGVMNFYDFRRYIRRDDRVEDNHVEYSKHLTYFVLGNDGPTAIGPPFRLSIKLRQLSKWMAQMGWPADSTVLKANIIPVAVDGGQWRIVRVEEDQGHFESGCVGSEEEAIALAKATSARKLKEETQARRRVGGAKGERIGPLRRASNITERDLIREFKLRGVKFGSCIPQVKSQEWLAHFYDSFHDLSAALKWPAEMMGLRGLALHVGIVGDEDRTAYAHYDTVKRVLSFTRASGAGFLAHEWAHALDNFLYRSLFPGPLYRRSHRLMLSNVIYRVPANFFPREKQDFVDLINFFFQRINHSEYFKHALNSELPWSEGTYWTKNSELFARAFEAFVEDRLADIGCSNPFMVHGTFEQCWTGWKEQTDCAEYPLGDERREFNDLFLMILDKIPQITRTR